MNNLRNPSRPRHSRTRFVPQLEALEDRNCPSFIAVEGHTLLIRGDNTADTISITDSGNGTVSGTIDGQSATGTAIHNIVVHTGGGDDTLTYTLTNPLTSAEHLQINMGSGKDSATLDFSPGITDTHLKVDFTGGRGDDTLTTKFGPIMDSQIYFRANLGKGADMFDGSLLGNIMGDSAVRFLVQGGKGEDTLDATATLNAGSMGEFLGRVKGGQGTNNLTFDVIDNSGGMADVDAFLFSHAGDTVTNTPNVVVVQPHADDGGHAGHGS